MATMKNQITVVLTAYNEEEKITKSLQSAKLLSNDIIVIDTQSIDRTVAVAKKNGAKVYSLPYERFVEPTRGFAIEKAGGAWVFILDADELISPELATEIRKTVAKTNKTHFIVPRKNIFAGKKWLKHGGWYPDYVIRLIKKDAFVNWPGQIHSTPEISGDGGNLKNPLRHHFHNNIEAMVQKTAVFEDIESELLYEAGKTATTTTFFRKFLGELWRRLMRNLGFIDGSYGIIESIYQAYSKTITYLMLYEKNKKSRNI